MGQAAGGKEGAKMGIKRVGAGRPIGRSGLPIDRWQKICYGRGM